MSALHDSLVLYFYHALQAEAAAAALHLQALEPGQPVTAWSPFYRVTLSAASATRVPFRITDEGAPDALTLAQALAAAQGRIDAERGA